MSSIPSERLSASGRENMCVLQKMCVLRLHSERGGWPPRRPRGEHRTGDPSSGIADRATPGWVWCSSAGALDAAPDNTTPAWLKVPRTWARMDERRHEHEGRARWKHVRRRCRRDDPRYPARRPEPVCAGDLGETAEAVRASGREAAPF